MLDPAGLYLGDNGRCFCGQAYCAGATAYYSGHDLSGQKVEGPLSPEDIAFMEQAIGHPLTCETCGKGGQR